MTKLKRFTGKVFGGSATAVGDDPQIAQFGSALANTFVGTTDPEIIQQLPAWGQGWIGAVTPTQQYPALPEMTGAMKVLSHQICGILQQGVSTWDNGTIYYNGNFVSLNGKLYISQTDENQGNNPATDTTNWQEFSSGGGLEIGDIGIAPLGIDENKNKRRYLNGQIIIQEQFLSFTTKVKEAIALYPTLACSESDWQATALLTVGGQVGKFVVDDEAGTIRLPKIIMPIQGLTDLSKLAEIVEAGLPNITGTFNENAGSSGGIQKTPEGAFLNTRTGTTRNYGGGNGALLDVDVDFNASLSNPIYGKSNTVQQEAIQYPYFIQVATGAETEDNIINEIELNNPYSLFDSKYSDHELNNLSWLKSKGQWNSKAVYTTAYDKLLKVYNGTETVNGLSVKLSTEEYTDYDFVLNTADETFRLPLKTKLASGKAVVGNGISVGLMSDYGGVSNVSALDGNSSGLGTSAQAYGQATGYASSARSNLLGGIGITTDPTKSGIETSDSGLFLYYYVGETVQNANLINAGRIEEKLVDKADTNASNFTADGKILISGWGYPSSKYIDLTLGASGSKYTAPANGWLFIEKKATGAGQYVGFYNGYLRPEITAYANGINVSLFIPVRKGYATTINYNLGGTTAYFRFIYALGSESEAQ